MGSLLPSLLTHLLLQALFNDRLRPFLPALNEVFHLPGALGGQIGLFMGASLFTLFEIILAVLCLLVFAVSSIIRWLSPREGNVQEENCSALETNKNFVPESEESKVAWGK